MIDLTLLDDQDGDEEMSDEELESPDMPTKGWIGLKTVRLNDGSHIVTRLAPDSSSATSGKNQIGVCCFVLLSGCTMRAWARRIRSETGFSMGEGQGFQLQQDFSW